jgi:hypothetical protein
MAKPTTQDNAGGFMKVERTEANYALIKLGIDELVALNNALNEVCHALDITEFSTRMGVQLEAAQDLLQQIGEIIDIINKKEDNIHK